MMFTILTPDFQGTFVLTVSFICTQMQTTQKLRVRLVYAIACLGAALPVLLSASCLSNYHFIPTINREIASRRFKKGSLCAWELDCLHSMLGCVLLPSMPALLALMPLV